MFPALPYTGYTWPINHHWGVVDELNLKQILLAAVLHSDSRDPSQDINNYLVVNGLLTPNVRSDSGQSDAWRDYQQILSELGLIYSTRSTRRITPTVMGLALLDNTLTYSEVLTLQALRFQYPNGHNTTISSSLKKLLQSQPQSTITKLTTLQQAAGVKIRPAVLTWRILWRLYERSSAFGLSIDEFSSYVMYCTEHSDIEPCIDAILDGRNDPRVPLQIQADEKRIDINWYKRKRRNAQDWYQYLSKTMLFSVRNHQLCISAEGMAHRRMIETICTTLSDPDSFWVPSSEDIRESIQWYSEYGTIRTNLSLPSEHDANQSTAAEIESRRQIVLQEYNASTLRNIDSRDGAAPQMITSSYSAELSDSQTKLHDLMVQFIAHLCLQRGARVYQDPNTVDLLIIHDNIEYIVEVKSVSARNLTKRVRLAVGQILHYDYLRNEHSSLQRRKVIALSAELPHNSWCVPFLNDYLDIDLLSLKGERLQVNSRFGASSFLFTV